MGLPGYLQPLQCIIKQPSMGDPLDRAISASLRRGLSDELRELADFGLSGHAPVVHDYMHIEVREGSMCGEMSNSCACSHTLIS
jgi:hypothetical protein